MPANFRRSATFEAGSRRAFTTPLAFDTILLLSPLFFSTLSIPDFTLSRNSWAFAILFIAVSKITSANQEGDERLYVSRQKTYLCRRSWLAQSLLPFLLRHLWQSRVALNEPLPATIYTRMCIGHCLRRQGVQRNCSEDE